MYTLFQPSTAILDLDVKSSTHDRGYRCIEFGNCRATSATQSRKPALSDPPSCPRWPPGPFCSARLTLHHGRTSSSSLRLSSPLPSSLYRFCALAYPCEVSLLPEKVLSWAQNAIPLVSRFLLCLFANLMHPTVCGNTRIEFLRILREARLVLVLRDDVKLFARVTLPFLALDECPHEF